MKKIDYRSFEEEENIPPGVRKMKSFDKVRKNESQPDSDLPSGRVIEISPEAYYVHAENKVYPCQLKGTVKKMLRESNDRIACGDRVLFDPKTKHIVSPEKRSSVLMRRNPSQKHRKQILAANIDLLCITSSVINPPPDPYLIDLYLIAAQKEGLQPVIVINKTDLLPRDESSKEVRLLKELEEQYLHLGIPFLCVSAHTGEGLETLRNIRKDHAPVFSGASGVGKSSLLNRLESISLKIAPVGEKSGKGRHTTTSSKLFLLKNGGWCVDTPGIQSFSVNDLHREELSDYFPEFSALSCKFHDCRHNGEAGCSLPEKPDKKVIYPLRLKSYTRLLKELNSES